MEEEGELSSSSTSALGRLMYVRRFTPCKTTGRPLSPQSIPPALARPYSRLYTPSHSPALVLFLSPFADSLALVRYLLPPQLTLTARLRDEDLSHFKQTCDGLPCSSLSVLPMPPFWPQQEVRRTVVPPARNSPNEECSRHLRSWGVGTRLSSLIPSPSFLCRPGSTTAPNLRASGATPPFDHVHPHSYCCR